MRKNLRRVRKEDYERVILSETSPYEVSIIYSNFSYYNILKKFNKESLKNKRLYSHIIWKNASDYTIPMAYKIRKDESSFRNLSLLHPSSQAELVDLYRDFDRQIINACRKSNFTIRTPTKVANKYYIDSPTTQKDPHKRNEVASLKDEVTTKFLTSYFSYGGYTRLHKFFDSDEFLSLEKKFSIFWSLDVTRCFDSIYTHSITWALKTKPFSKQNKNIQNTLGSVFDRAMQASNFNETAGIVIGPEASRIFSEIIFQEIDREVESRLEVLQLSHGTEYEIKRYVDDIFLFTSNKSIAEKITLVIESCLGEYKLSINKGKTSKASRPFVTQKTKSILNVKESIDKLTSKLLQEDDENVITVSKINSRKKVSIKFINEIKAACIGDNEAYELACNFTIAALTNFITRLSRKEIQNKSQPETKRLFEIIIYIIFHFYTTHPTHSGSVNICKIIYSSCEYFEKNYPDECNAIKSLIFKLSTEFFKTNESLSPDNEHAEFTNLEVLNIFCALKRLGSDFQLTEFTVRKIIKNKKQLSYFELTSTLYYIGDSSSYMNIRASIEKQIKNDLKNFSDIRENTYKAHILLDSLSCPYINKETKESIAKAYILHVKREKPTPAELDEFLDEAIENSWFISWDDTNLLHTLEKKQLLKGY